MDRTIRLPIHVQEKLRKIRRAEQTLLAETGTAPTATQVANFIGADKERFLHFMWKLNASNTAELDAPISEDLSLGDIRIDENAASPFDTIAETQLHQKLNEALGSLTPREERVIRMRFGIYGDMDHTLEEIGQIFGVTRERIRQIEAKALKKLRHPVRSRYLEHFR
jgi:RNA polymerase primary sigma factor